MKFKVGDKVKVIKDLKSNTKYGNTYTSDDDGMIKFANKTVTIAEAEVSEEREDYHILEDSGKYFWSEEMFSSKVREKKEKPKTTEDVLQNFADILKENTEDSNKMIANLVSNFADNVTTIDKSIKEISKNLNSRTIYDEEIINTLKERITKMTDEDVKKIIKDETEFFIKKNYGVLPKKIELKDNLKTKEIKGLFHEKFETILKIVKKGVPVMLTGPAGAGKNHTLEQIAEALDLDFYFTNAVTQEYKLTGFIDANGVYQETQFYKAFKDGGLFFLDEVDASCPEALITLNSAIANGYFDFPNGKVQANKNFRVACAGNTYGTGADMVYVGRNVLDGATLDRFVTIEFDYDSNIEKQLAYDDDLYYFIVALRNAIHDASLRYIVSMRATINSTKMLEIGMPKKEILKTTIIKNMQMDDLNVIIKKINGNNEWIDLLKGMVR